MDTDSTIDVEFELKNILNMNYDLVKTALENLKDAIHVFFANSREEYMKKSFSYEMPRLHISRIRNKVYFSIPVRKGIAVIKITNKFVHPIFYSLLLNIDGRAEMHTLVPTLGYVEANKQQVYSFKAKYTGYLNIDFDSCLGKVVVMYA